MVFSIICDCWLILSLKKHSVISHCFVSDKGSSIKDFCKNTVKIDPSPCPLLSALGHNPLSVLWTSAKVTEYVVNRDYYQNSMSTGKTRCWLQAVSGCYIYLPIACTSNTSVCMLQAAIYSASNFITIFVTKRHTLLHVADVHSLNHPLSALGYTPSPSFPCKHPL